MSDSIQIAHLKSKPLYEIININIKFDASKNFQIKQVIAYFFVELVVFLNLGEFTRG